MDLTADVFYRQKPSARLTNLDFFIITADTRDSTELQFVTEPFDFLKDSRNDSIAICITLVVLFLPHRCQQNIKSKDILCLLCPLEDTKHI